MIITKTEGSFYKIGIPVPFPMKYVYCYLFINGNHSVLIDVGLNYPEAREAWNKVFEELEFDPKQIESIYLTHFHPDHTGLAGWMQEKTGANVFISETDKEAIDRTWGENSVQTKRVGDMVVANGVPQTLADQIMDHMNRFFDYVSPSASITPLHAEEIRISDKMWQVIQTPGHSDGHVCFYNKENGILIAGDHLLDKITPNVSLYPGCHENPLKNYLHSLKKTKELEVTTVYTGHGKTIKNPKERIDEIIDHHKERLEFMENIAKKGKTAYEVAQQAFNAEKLTPHQWRFAMAETLAHLEYLKYEGKLSNERNGKLFQYFS